MDVCMYIVLVGELGIYSYVQYSTAQYSIVLLYKTGVEWIIILVHIMLLLLDLVGVLWMLAVAHTCTDDEALQYIEQVWFIYIWHGSFVHFKPI